MTPSAASAASAACAGLEIPRPSSTGLSVAALHRCPITLAWSGELVALAGHAHERDAVDEPSGALADARAGARRGSSDRRAGRSRSRPRPPPPPAVELVEREVGDDRAVDAACDQCGREPLVAHVLDRVVVRHHDERDVDVELREVGGDAGRRRPRCRARAARPPGSSDRPSPGPRTGSRSRSRRHRRAATARTTSSHAAPRPPVTYGTSSFFPASRFARRVVFELHASGSPVRRSATCIASLSPRPESVTSTVGAARDRPPRPRGRATRARVRARARGRSPRSG